LIWANYVDRREGDKVRWREIWERFPKFVIGYFLTFVGLFSLLMICKSRLDAPAYTQMLASAKLATQESDLFRTLFFGMTFFTIGLTANFKKLWAEGIGRLALVYVVSLFGFIIWIGLAISWIFFGGVRPPTAGGP
jgi:uncharacterized membrane protein YadS